MNDEATELRSADCPGGEAMGADPASESVDECSGVGETQNDDS